MARYALGRMLRWIPTVLFVLLVVYALAFFGAGDPIKLIFLRAPGDVAYDPERIAAIEHQYGLDRPFLVQFGNYVTNLVQGNLGNSLVEKRSVLNMISAAFPISLQLGVAATLIMALAGIPLGVVAALKQNSWLDNLIVTSALFFWAVPSFVIGPLLMLLIVNGFRMQVPYGWNGLFSPTAILPVLILALGPLALIIRQTRSAVLEVLAEDYIRTARSKGISDRLVIFRHILRPVLTPIVTQLGLVLITIINGAVLVEVVFGIPGLGRLTISSVTNVDYPVILAITLIGSFLVMVSNLFVDVVYPVLDPRAAQTQRGG